MIAGGAEKDGDFGGPKKGYPAKDAVEVGERHPKRDRNSVFFWNFLISCDVWWTSVYILGRFVGGVTCTYRYS